MKSKANSKEIRGYCSQCSGWCPTISYVKDGVFVKVRPDDEHPLACGLCPKGLFGPELVYNAQRLQNPMRRTKPKGDPDPGWERINWDEALDIVAAELNEIKAKFGPEAVAIGRSGPAGSPMGEVGLWVTRLANAFGTPNNIATTHICQWHRDCGSSYTYGNIGKMHSAGRAEFQNAACILIWGSNTHATRSSLIPCIKRGIDRGAKLIVVDPRKTEIAAMADLWLQVRPGTDGALVLSMINVMIEEGLYDHDFVRDWTTAPFLVRSDTGNFLRANELTNGGETSSYVIMDSVSKDTVTCTPGKPLSTDPVLDGTSTIKLAKGGEIDCKTVFRLLRDSVAEYSPSRAEALTGVPEEKIRDAATMFATTKPACWYTWNGIEQNVNATQTNRALCILYALTGNFDTPGGNVILTPLPLNPVIGFEFLSPEVNKKRLGFAERPLGPGGKSFRSTQAYEVYRAILTGKPYPIRALLGFGGNLIMSNAPSTLAREAISQLDFHVQTELFLSPTAELADIVLPAASSWESWHVGVNFAPVGDKAYVQLRPAVVSPQHESWPDMKIISELAKRLGLVDMFWDGDVEAGFDYHLAPADITVEQLRKNSGPVSIDLSMEYRKYAKMDEAGNFLGFTTPSKRVEIYSPLFKEHGHDPLPTWEDPMTLRFWQEDVAEKYPLILIGGKVVEYSHSQHRALPSLRKRVPHPFLEINPQKAGEIGCQEGDWVLLETPYGSITLQARLSEAVLPDVVFTQNGWWQPCPELNLPGYDPYSSKGANVNLLYSTEEMDPISGSLPLKGHPCNVRKI